MRRKVREKLGLSGSSGPHSPGPPSNDTALATFHATLKIVKASVSGLGVPGLEAAVGGVLEVVAAARASSIHNMRGNQDEIVAFTESILRLHDEIIAPLRTAITTNPAYVTLELNQRLSSLTNDILKLKSEAEGLATRGRWQRFLNNQDDTELLLILNRQLDRSIQAFMMSGGLASEIAITELRQGVSTDLEKIGERLDQAASALLAGQTEALTFAQSQLIKDLPRAHARHDSAARNDARSCFEGTRRNTLQDIADWIESTDRTKPIYWLRGAAGVGKSTIAQTVAEREDAKFRLGASFFFSRDEANRRNALLVFPTIAFQLATFDPQLKRLIADSLERHPDVGYATMRQQVDKLVVEPLIAWGSSDRTVVIILDAFDECDPETGAKEILTLWAAEIPRIPTNLKVLVTSRPELHIRNTFQLPILRQISHHCILQDIEDSIVEADIELYLRHHLNEIAANCELEIPWPTDREVRMLVQNSGTLFIFAATAIKFAGDPKVCDPQGRLDLLLEQKPPRERSRYREVDQLYLQILGRSLPDDKDDREEAAAHFREVVGTIVLIVDPLPSGPLEMLLRLRPGRVRRSLLHLHSVMLVPESVDGQIRVLHPSFRDFLTDIDRCSDPHFRVDPPTGHSFIAILCIEHLVSSLKRDPTECGNSWTLNSEIVDLEARVKDAFQRHLQYCCIYFSSHVASARTDNSNLLRLLDQFFHTRLLVWMEALSLMDQIDTAITALRSIRAWYSGVYEPKSLTKELVSDAIRFLLHLKPALQRGAGQLYASGLHHAPKSALRRQYMHEMGPKYIVRGVSSGWDPCISVLRGVHAPYCAAFTAGAEYIIAAGTSENGHLLQVWNAFTSTEVGSYVGHEDQRKLCDIGIQKSTSSVHVWDVVTGALLGKLSELQGSIGSIHILQSDSRILTAGEDGVLRIWDPATCALDGLWVGFGSVDRSTAFWQLDREICFWNCDEGTMLRSITVLPYTTHLALSPDGVHVALVSQSSNVVAHSVLLYSLENWTLLASLTGHSGKVNSMAFSGDGSNIVTTSSDSTVRLWDFSSALTLGDQGASPEVVTHTSLSGSEDGARVLSLSLHSSRVRLWNIKHDSPLAEIETEITLLLLAVISPGGQWIATGGWSEVVSVQLWRTETMELATSWSTGKKWDLIGTGATVFSQDGSLLASSFLPRGRRSIWI
ncbi:hypothetical protein FRC05_004211 [Tulasnella sp. 425]|nr:hypothetical protein FRC05_004211 [Tulasnella sp. 425]